MFGSCFTLLWPCHLPKDEEVLNDEELDKEFLWNLQLLSEVN